MLGGLNRMITLIGDKKMRNKWYIKFPADAYAIGPIEFPQSVNEKEVRQYARDFEGCTRLPIGFECWPVSS